MATRRVLIADDSKLTIKLLRSALAKLSYSQIDVIGDGLNALKMILAQTYDLIILDHNMPNITGIDVVRRLRVMKPVYKAPIFIVTGSVTNELLTMIKEHNLGITGVISKPFTVDTLYEKLSRVSTPIRPNTPPESEPNPAEGQFASGNLTARVADYQKFIGITYKGTATGNDAAMIKKTLYRAMTMAVNHQVVIDVSGLKDFNEAFLGLILLFIGMITRKGARVSLIIGATMTDNRFIKLGFDKLAPCFGSIAEYNAATGLS